MCDAFVFVVAEYVFFFALSCCRDDREATVFALSSAWLVVDVCDAFLFVAEYVFFFALSCCRDDREVTDFALSRTRLGVDACDAFFVVIEYVWAR